MRSLLFMIVAIVAAALAPTLVAAGLSRLGLYVGAVELGLLYVASVLVAAWAVFRYSRRTREA